METQKHKNEVNLVGVVLDISRQIGNRSKQTDNKTSFWLETGPRKVPVTAFFKIPWLSEGMLIDVNGMLVSNSSQRNGRWIYINARKNGVRPAKEWAKKRNEFRLVGNLTKYGVYRSHGKPTVAVISKTDDNPYSSTYIQTQVKNISSSELDGHDLVEISGRVIPNLPTYTRTVDVETEHVKLLAKREVPTFENLQLPVLKAINNLGGAAQINKIKEEVRRGYQARHLLNQKTKSGEPLINNRMSWSLINLEKLGLISRTGRGMFEITEKGKHLLLCEPRSINKGTARS